MIALEAPDATQAWTTTGGSAPTCLEASDKVVMVVTDTTTAFLDASTGKKALPALNTTHEFESSNGAEATYAHGVFYYLCDAPDADNLVAAVDGSTGEVKWAISMALSDSGNSKFSTPNYVAVNRKTVYVCGTVRVLDGEFSPEEATTGYIRAFDGETGKGLWRIEGMDINNVLVPSSGSHLLAASSTPRGQDSQVQMIDASKQGARGWKIPTQKAKFFETGWPKTCYANGLFFFAGGVGDTLIAVDASTGAEKWREEFEAIDGGEARIGSPFASLDGSAVYVPVGSDLASFSSADGALRWVARLPEDSGYFNASLMFGGKSAQCSADTVFVTDTAKTLWAIDAATGQARWRYADPGQPDVGFRWTVGGDRVFIASNLTLTAISAHGDEAPRGG